MRNKTSVNILAGSAAPPFIRGAEVLRYIATKVFSFCQTSFPSNLRNTHTKKSLKLWVIREKLRRQGEHLPFFETKNGNRPLIYLLAEDSEWLFIPIKT